VVMTWQKLYRCLRRIPPSMMCLCISLFVANNKEIENVNTWFILSNSHTIYKSDNQQVIYKSLNLQVYTF
jgi:hypothetical protein